MANNIQMINYYNHWKQVANDKRFIRYCNKRIREIKTGKREVRSSVKVKVYVKSIDREFDSLSQASYALGYSRSYASRCINGTIPNPHGIRKTLKV